ncbi:MAG: hypothetical protein U0N71_09455 [Collinsella sp.]
MGSLLPAGAVRATARADTQSPLWHPEPAERSCAAGEAAPNGFLISSFSEIQKLIDFALDLTIELFAKITGIEKDRLPKNYNDIQGLLKYAEVGMEAVEQHLGNL